jgi:hypothetical protein
VAVNPASRHVSLNNLLIGWFQEIGLYVTIWSEKAVPSEEHIESIATSQDIKLKIRMSAAHHRRARNGTYRTPARFVSTHVSAKWQDSATHNAVQFLKACYISTGILYQHREYLKYIMECEAAVRLAAQCINA